MTKGDDSMIVTIIALAITALNCLLYFAPLMDYLTSRYWTARRISPMIANQDLKRTLPDIVDLASSIQNTLATLIVLLRIFQVSIQYLSGAITIFAIASVVLAIGIVVNPRQHMREILSSILGAILVAVFCFPI